MQRRQLLDPDPISNRYSLCELVGGSEAMRNIYEAIKRVASGDTSVTIRGESGTGKELVARAIASLSKRNTGPFVSVNCAALPALLMESELFGHEKGSFTGAHAASPGQIELADRGTLFLDEIGCLNLELQSKLLRVLQDRAVQRIGGKQARKIDFRLITATNADLEGMVKEGRFREDLYYRIHVIPITLPPLRDRIEDLALLIDHFVRQYCNSGDLEPKRFSTDAMALLEEYAWPGNIRELENLVQRLLLMVDAQVIVPEHLPQHILYDNTVQQEMLLIPDGGIDFDQEMHRIEQAYLQAALRRTAGRQAAAGALLKLKPQQMKYLCRKHKLQRVKL